MFTDSLANIQRKRAEYARDVEFMREMASDDLIDDITAKTEQLYLKESVIDDEEIELIMEKITGEDDMSEKEIQRIMEATEDMTFDEMVGVAVYE